jgi:hypothetical protein
MSSLKIQNSTLLKQYRTTVLKCISGVNWDLHSLLEVIIDYSDSEIELVYLERESKNLLNGSDVLFLKSDEFDCTAVPNSYTSTKNLIRYDLKSKTIGRVTSYSNLTSFFLPFIYTDFNCTHHISTYDVFRLQVKIRSKLHNFPLVPLEDIKLGSTPKVDEEVECNLCGQIIENTYCESTFNLKKNLKDNVCNHHLLKDQKFTSIVINGIMYDVLSNWNLVIDTKQYLVGKEICGKISYNYNINNNEIVSSISREEACIVENLGYTIGKNVKIIT